MHCLSEFDENTQNNIKLWLEDDYDAETKKTVNLLLNQDKQSIIDAFYTSLSFGTGGLRGVMGVGSNRMNQYTVAAATQGLANYIHKNIQTQDIPSVVIGYDSRNNSAYFAEIAANVLAANNIKVFIYKSLRPVPMVSFGVRLKKSIAGIMITASHNPPEYNGYKVYWNDGAQVLPPHDVGIIEEVNKIKKIAQVKSVPDVALIEQLEEEIDLAYLDAIRPLQVSSQTNLSEGKKLHIVYTPLHGSGITMVPKALNDWGFTNINIVSSQEKPDGNFPTVVKPNPEEQAALKLGIEEMMAKNADILLGTDPDCDRIGIAINHQNQAILFNGNETACVCLYYLCKKMKELNTFPNQAACVKTIVTTELFQAIANSYGVKCFNVLTGFKYIGQLITQWEKDHSWNYLFGGEESYGYLLGTHARDKDAIVSSALICEIANWAKTQHKTLVDILYDIYREFGIYREKLVSINFKEGKEGKDTIKKMMDLLRNSPPTHLANSKILVLEDYQNRLRKDFTTLTETPLTLPKSNVLLFWLEGESKLVIRPSGTEPKVKIYCGVKKQNPSSIETGIEQADQNIDYLIESLKNLVT